MADIVDSLLKPRVRVREGDFISQLKAIWLPSKILIKIRTQSIDSAILIWILCSKASSGPHTCMIHMRNLSPLITIPTSSPCVPFRMTRSPLLSWGHWDLIFHESIGAQLVIGRAVNWDSASPSPTSKDSPDSPIGPLQDSRVHGYPRVQGWRVHESKELDSFQHQSQVHSDPADISRIHKVLCPWGLD